MGIGLWLKLGAGLAIAAALGGAYLHYQGLVSERDSLRKKNTQQEMEISLKDGAISQLRGERDRAIEREQQTIERSEAVQKRLVAATQRVDEARQMFADSDFASLLAEKPELLTKMMARATRQVFSNIEEAANRVEPEEEPEGDEQ